MSMCITTGFLVTIGLLRKGRVYHSRNISTLLKEAPRDCQRYQNCWSLAPTGGGSTTRGALDTGGTHGERPTKETPLKTLLDTLLQKVHD